jgi:hypothetical protein
MSLTLQTIYFRCKTSKATGDCRIWKQSCSKSGYPRLTLKGAPSQYAHICAWIIKNGPVPEGHVLGNECGNKRCCWPAHWLPRTRAEQNRIAASHGAWTGAERSTKIALSARRLRGKLDEAKVLQIRDPHRTVSDAELAREWNVSPGLVSKVNRGKGWRLLAPFTQATRKPGRYEVTDAPPLFSAMRIGQYEASGTAISRALA